jgi:raffinose/stachyose/melibiose transport system permease protein
MSDNLSAKTVNILKAIPLYILAAIWMYPFFLLVTSTFKKGVNFFDFNVLPDFTYWDNYIKVFECANVLRPFLVSVTLTVSTMTLTVIFASMAGYSLARGRKKIFSYIYLLFASGLIIPAQSNMIPIYKLGVTIGMINTIPFLVMIYVAGLSAYAALIYASFTKNVPQELENSARIDGCGFLTTFIFIIFPLLLPATGTVLATTTYWIWNDFQHPLIYLNEEKYYTLIMLMFKFQNETSKSTQWGPTFVIAFLVSLPMIVLFLFAQKYILRGIVAGSLKG